MTGGGRTGEDARGDRAVRLLELSPVVAALAVNAVAHERWLLCAPVACGLIGAGLARWSVRHGSLRLLLSVVAGGVLGLLLLWVNQPPLGPIPAQVLSPLCGALVGLAALCGLTRRVTYSWIYACLLAALSLHVPSTPGLVAALALLAASLLACAYVRGGLARTGPRGALAFGGFVLVLGLGAFGLNRLVHWSEGTLMGLIYELVRERPNPGGFGVQTELTLSERSSVRASMRPLLELPGAIPERLRATVLDQFDGNRWSTSRALAELRLEPPASAAGSGESSATELVFLEPMVGRLPAPAGTRAVEGAAAELRGGWVLRTGKLGGTVVTLRGGPDERLPTEAPPGPALVALPEELRAELLPLARELTAGAEGAREKAKALERHFREQFQYSLSANLEGEGSPLAVLIRERRPAYCIYFASAMAALLRGLDVPARLVGGFVPEERNPITGTALVRERDAHAWVEVYLEDEGRFVAFDPTPWRSRDAVLGLDERPGWLASLAGAIGSVLRRGWAALASRPVELLWRMVSSPITLGLAVVALGWRWFRRRRRVRAGRRREALAAVDPEHAAVYARYLRVLEKSAGLVPGAAETDDELLARLRTLRGDEAAEVATALIADYRLARYRPEVPVPALAPTALLERVARLEAVLRRPAG